MALFENMTFDFIMERMLSRIPDSVDKREGSVVYDLLAPAAIEMALAYIEMDNVLELAFADTTYGPYLERRAAERGVNRKGGTKATGNVKLIGPIETVIEAGTRLSTIESVPRYFLTNDTATIGADGFANVKAIAETSGEESNVKENEIAIVTGDLSGVVSVENEEFSGGSDAESDEELLLRYYAKVQKPSTSGNKYQYEEWAREVQGVADARCFPRWQGKGTVRVVIIDSAKRSPSQAVINKVFNYIESVRPVGADLTVSGVSEVSIDVAVKLILSDSETNLQALKQEVIGKIEDFLKSIAFTGEILRYSQVANVILETSNVIDYENLTINRGTSNIVLAADEVPVMGAVTITV